MLPIKEMKGAAAMRAIGRVVGPLMAIAEDAETMATIADAGTDDLGKALEVFTENHAEDLVAVLAACNGMTPAEYEDAATFDRILADFAAVVTDSDVIGFLSGASQSNVLAATA